MESRTQILGHPVHQVAVMFPIGALGLAVVSDVVHAATGERELAVVAERALNFGLVTAAIAAPFGLRDWLAIRPGTRAKRVGRWHAIGNVAVLALFAAARLLRTDKHVPRTAKLLAGAGLVLTSATAWAGTELINRHGIGVHDLLDENAPSSLQRLPA
jgi:uncharacterized membrane protein